MATYCMNCGAAQGGAWAKCPDGSSHQWDDPAPDDQNEQDQAHHDQEELEKAQLGIKAVVGFAVVFFLILYLAFSFSW